jgi:hypothetical protein
MTLQLQLRLHERVLMLTDNNAILLFLLFLLAITRRTTDLNPTILIFILIYLSLSFPLLLISSFNFPNDLFRFIEDARGSCSACITFW